MKHGFKVLLVVMNAFLLTGCITAGIVSDGFEKRETADTVTQDSIIAVGQPQAPAAASPSGEASPPLVALVGLNHTYVLSKGGLEISVIARGLDGQYIVVNKGEPTIHLTTGLVKESQPDGAQFVEGRIRISYDKPAAQYTQAEKQILEQMHFITRNNDTFATIDIEGLVYPKANNLQAIQTQFKQSRAVEFHHYTYQTSTNYGKYALLPFGVAFDVLTSPIQLPFVIYGLNHMQIIQ